MTVMFPGYSDPADILQLNQAIQSLIDNTLNVEPQSYPAALVGGSANVNAQYVEVGKLVFVEFYATITGPLSGTIYLTSPSTMAGNAQIGIGTALALDGGVTATRRSMTVHRDTNALRVFFTVDSLATSSLVTSTVPWTWANSDTIAGSFTYVKA